MAERIITVRYTTSMKPKDIQFDHHNDMAQRFHLESDRGAAVLAGSYVENVIGKFLGHKMKDKSVANELFDSNGPLSTFSQRILIAHAFGFLSSSTCASLNYIKKIRNHFAHHPFDASFDLSPVKDWGDELIKLVPLREGQEETRDEFTRRNAYLISCSYIALNCQVAIGDRGRRA